MINHKIISTYRFILHAWIMNLFMEPSLFVDSPRLLGFGVLGFFFFFFFGVVVACLFCFVLFCFVLFCFVFEIRSLCVVLTVLEPSLSVDQAGLELRDLCASAS
jgi:hypothetical protein